MKKLLLLVILCIQFQLYSEEVINYDREFQRKIDSLKSQLDSLIDLRNLELDKLKSQIKKLNQLEKENLELQKKLNECSLSKNDIEKNLNTLKEKLLNSESQNMQTKKENEQLKETNKTLESRIDYLKNKQRKLKDLVKKLSEYAKNKKEKEDKIYSQYQDLKKDITSAIKPDEGQATIHKNDDYTRLIINLNEAVSFNSGSATIKNQAKPLLDSIFKIITKYPGYHIFIEGHTDNVPIHSARINDNWELSTKRALNVLGYALKKNPSLDPKRFSASGYGEFHPQDTNDTAEGRKRNRRVDIIVMYR